MNTHSPQNTGTESSDPSMDSPSQDMSQPNTTVNDLQKSSTATDSQSTPQISSTVQQPLSPTDKPLDETAVPWQQNPLNISPTQTNSVTNQVPVMPIQNIQSSTQTTVTPTGEDTVRTPESNTSELQNLPSDKTADITPVVEGGKGNSSKIIRVGLLIFIIILVLSSLTSLVFGAKYLKENHIPLVSGLTEDVLLTDGEQFSSRVEYLTSLGVYKALTAENSLFQPDFDPNEIKPVGADKIIGEIENAEQINYEMSLNVNYSLKERLSPVLGLKDPGDLNENTIQKIMNSKEGTITFSSQDSVQFNNQDRARNITNLELSAGGVNLNTGIESRVIDEMLYVNLDRFPRNEYVDLEKISGKWLEINPKEWIDDLGYGEELLGATGLSKEDLDIKQEDLKKEDYDKVIAFINSDAVKNSITNSYEEKVGDTNAKCYVLSLTEENLINMIKEAAKILDEEINENDLEEEYSEIYPFEKSDITLCFAKMESYPVKVVYDFEVNEDGNNVSGKMEFKLMGMKMITPIEKPENPTPFGMEDIEELVIYTPAYDPMPTTIMTPENEDDDYDPEADPYSESNFYNKGNACTYLKGYATCTYCDQGQPDCQVCLDAFNGLMLGRAMSDELIDKCY